MNDAEEANKEKVISIQLSFVTFFIKGQALSEIAAY